MVAHNTLSPGVPLVPASLVTGSSTEDLALRDLAAGEQLEIETAHHTYLIENCGKGKVLIAGHPEYCPRPVLVDLLGASGGGRRFRIRAICRDSHMEFVHPVFGAVQTSAIKNIRKISSAQPATTTPREGAF